jgi:hypothetical protein
MTTWHIGPAPASAWTLISWGSGSTGGTAYVGWVGQIYAGANPATSQKGVWIYDDFHADGGYAMSASPGPKGGAWAWISSFYPAGAKPEQHGEIVWRKSSATRIDRTFFTLDNRNAPHETSTDYCTTMTKH